jgi:hypothetical protein
MSTLINVTIAEQSLLQDDKERREVNRAAFIDKAQETRLSQTTQTAGQEILQERGINEDGLLRKPIINSRNRYFKKKVAAYRRSGYPVAYGFLNTGADDGTGIIHVLKAADGTTSAQFTGPSIPEFQPVAGSVLPVDEDFFFLTLLPVDASSFIFYKTLTKARFEATVQDVEFYEPAPEGEPDNTVTSNTMVTDTKSGCFLVSRNSVRAIDVPGVLADISAYDPTGQWIYTGLNGWYAKTDPGPELSEIVIFPYRLKIGPGLPPNGNPDNSYIQDPAIYKTIKNMEDTKDLDLSYGSPEFGSFLASESPPNISLSQCELDGTCSLTNWGFDFTENPDDPDPAYFRNPDADREVQGEDLLFDEPLITWDWERPDYCREQLLSLGFSSADLVP